MPFTNCLAFSLTKPEKYSLLFLKKKTPCQKVKIKRGLRLRKSNVTILFSSFVMTLTNVPNRT